MEQLQMSTVEDRHLAEMNRQLRLDEDYCDGMAFVPSPPGSTGRQMSGYDVAVGTGELMPIYARVAHAVARQFGLES
jgi:hypothetical protein